MKLENYTRAVQDFEKVRSIRPDMNEGWTQFNLAVAYTQLKQWRKAASLFKTAADNHPNKFLNNVYYYLNMANVLFNLGDFQGVIGIAEKGLRRFPDNPMVLNMIALSYLALNQPKKFETISDRATATAWFKQHSRTSSVFRLPFRGRWIVAQGNDSTPTHKGLAGKFAWDFIKIDARGRSFRGKGAKNEDYFGFGSEVLAPADGEVIEVRDDFPDNEPNAPYRQYLGKGNRIVIRHADGIHSFITHLKSESAMVKVGQRVAEGEAIGRCGNSGFSPVPHIHIVFFRNLPEGWISVPARFRDYRLWRQGREARVDQGVPSRRDIIAPNR